MKKHDEKVPPVAAEAPAPEADETIVSSAGETASLPEEDVEQVHYAIRHDLQKRVDLYLRDRLPDYSRNRLQKLIKSGAVLVNESPAKPSTLLHEGDTVDVTLPHQPPEEALPENIPLSVVYEDEGFIAINKQAKLIVHPARGHWTGTLINALIYYANTTHTTLSTGSDPWRPGIIHRLDRDTTGLILIAKTDEAHWRLAGQFERRTIKKTYLAIVHGSPAVDSDLIDAPLGVHPKIREKYAVRTDIGKPAQTVYTVIERFDGFSLLELAPRTGRTHQIRVHMAHAGYPIVGDTMYGGYPVTLKDIMGGKNTVRTVKPGAKKGKGKAKEPKAPPPPTENLDPAMPLMERQALHAYRLQFVHPLKFHRMQVEAPPPEDMVRLVELLRLYRGRE